MMEEGEEEEKELWLKMERRAEEGRKKREGRKRKRVRKDREREREEGQERREKRRLNLIEGYRRGKYKGEK